MSDIPKDLQKQWRKNPLLIKKLLWPDVYFYDKQREIIMSVWENQETYVPAGNMLGKDFVAGFIALAYFLAHYQTPRTGDKTNYVRVVTTSVKDGHLDVLWAEIGGYVATSRIPLSAKRGGPLVVTSHEIRHKNDLMDTEGNARNYLKGFVSAKGEGMQGHHALYTLLIADEASGIDDVAYTMSSTWAKKMLAIGNPHQCTNFFYRGVTGGDLDI